MGLGGEGSVGGRSGCIDSGSVGGILRVGLGGEVLGI